MSVWRTYRGLFRNGPLTRLLIGEFVSSIGDWLFLVAFVVIVYERTQNPVLLGIVGAARILPYVVLSIPAGMLSDRFDRRMVLLVTDIGRAACMLVLAWLVTNEAPLWAIAAVAIVSTCQAVFFYPAMGALLPSLVRDETEFGPANSAWATLDNLAWVVGPAIGGVLLATGDVATALLLNAVSFTLIAVILWRLPRAGAVGGAWSAGIGPEPDSLPVEDLRIVFGRGFPRSIDLRAIAGVLLIDGMAWFAFGGVTILIVILAVDVFRGGDAATGYLNAALGVGGTLGALLSTVLVLRPRLGRALLLGGAAMAIPLVVLGFAGVLVTAVAAIVVFAIGHLVLDVSRTTIFQRVVPDAYRGRFTGLLMTVQGTGEVAGTLVMPALVSVAGFGPVLGALGMILFLVTFLGVLLIGRAADRAVGSFDIQLRRIARLPIFGGLSAGRIEDALRALEPIRVAAGEVVVRQGDVADRFYVVAEGRFEVTRSQAIDGAPVAIRTLGRDDIFGERGLIARAPRSATVAALEPGLLFAMDGDVFLGVVGARRGVSERLMALYEAPAEATTPA